MKKDIEKQIDAICDVANNEVDEQVAVRVYKEAKNFCDNFIPQNDEDQKSYDRLSSLLKSFSSDFGISEKGVISPPQLKLYIERLQQILEQVEQNDFEDLDELQDEFVNMKEDKDLLFEAVSDHYGIMPYYTNKRFEKFEKLVKELNGFFPDAEAEREAILDDMFPNRHDEDYDEDEFDVNTFFERD